MWSSPIVHVLTRDSNNLVSSSALPAVFRKTLFMWWTSVVAIRNIADSPVDSPKLGFLLRDIGVGILRHHQSIHAWFIDKDIRDRNDLLNDNRWVFEVLKLKCRWRKLFSQFYQQSKTFWKETLVKDNTCLLYEYCSWGLENGYFSIRLNFKLWQNAFIPYNWPY